jgi:hypothetical protein
VSTAQVPSDAADSTSPLGTLKQSSGIMWVEHFQYRGKQMRKPLPAHTCSFYIHPAINKDNENHVMMPVQRGIGNDDDDGDGDGDDDSDDDDDNTIMIIISNTIIVIISIMVIMIVVIIIKGLVHCIGALE